MLLIDTNVILELMYPPHFSIPDYLEQQDAASSHLGAAGEAELQREALSCRHASAVII